MPRGKVLAGVILLAVVSLAVAAFYVPDLLVEGALETELARGLGTSAQVRKVNLALFDRDTVIYGVRLANPSGFESAALLGVKRVGVTLQAHDLRRDPVAIERAVLDGVTLDLERSLGSSNVEGVLDALHRREADTAVGSDGGEAPHVVIASLVVRAARVKLDVLSQTALHTKQELSLPELQLHDLGGSGASAPGLELADVSGEVLKALLGAVLAQGERVPPELAAELQDGLADLSPLSFQAGDQTLTVGGQAAPDEEASPEDSGDDSDGADAGGAVEAAGP
jgi:hypothetical protein